MKTASTTKVVKVSHATKADIKAVAAVACKPVKEAPTMNIPGATQQPCQSCGQLVWIAPTTTSKIPAKVPRFCTPCAVKYIGSENV